MLSRLRSRLSYANVTATVALFIALGGTSYGLATGSIGSREIKNNSVRSKDIRNNDVRSRDVRNSSLLAKDFKPGQLPAGARGPTGAQGSPGAPGLQGTPGQDATKLFAYIRDFGSGDTATVNYGSGVTGVSDDADPAFGYAVSFNRSLVNCVVQATAGLGNPGTSPGKSAASDVGIPEIVMNGAGADDRAFLRFRNDAGTAIDTSFLITAFC